jgi:hypothetical protein
MPDDGEEIAVSAAEETIGGQIVLDHHTDESDIIAHHMLMLFAHYHIPGTRYLQVQVRVGDIIITNPASFAPQKRPRGRLTRRFA